MSASNSLLSAPVRRTMMLLALPVLGEQMLNFLVGTVDVYLAGNLTDGTSRAAVSAVGVAAYVGWFASLVFSLVGTGTTALIARAWGAGQREQANEVLNRSVALAWLMGIAFLIFIVPAAPYIARLMGLGNEELPIAVRYLRIDGIGLVFSSFTLVASAALRGCGDMRTPMWILGAVNLLNVLLSMALVHGWGPLAPMGVDGIVVGTTCSRTLGALALLMSLVMGTSGLRLNLREWQLKGATVRRILSIGGPSAAEGILTWIGHAIFLRMISGEGNVAFNAHIIGVRVEAISYLPAVAWGAAAATLVGQSLGAKDQDRAWRAGHEAALQCGLFGVLTSLLFVLYSGPILSLMHEDPAVREVGTSPLSLLGAFQIPLLLAIVYASALRGAGDTRFPFVISLITNFALRIPVGYFFGVVLDMGLLGMWIGMCADITGRWVLNTYRYWTGRWMHVIVG
ncbi:MAG: MATE family efflux transporter [Planctomycetaceae bacterium]|nr:MATE family efflux transporter [Planctomycetaceae bacterium]